MCFDIFPKNVINSILDYLIDDKTGFHTIQKYMDVFRENWLFVRYICDAYIVYLEKEYNTKDFHALVARCIHKSTIKHYPEPKMFDVLRPSFEITGLKAKHRAIVYLFAIKHYYLCQTTHIEYGYDYNKPYEMERRLWRLAGTVAISDVEFDYKDLIRRKVYTPELSDRKDDICSLKPDVCIYKRGIVKRVIDLRLIAM